VREENAPSELDDLPSAVWRRIGEHEARLANGRERFEELISTDARLRDEIKSVREQLAPRPVRWWAVIAGGFGALVTVLSVVWALATQLAARPTAAEITNHPSITRIDEAIKSLARTVEETRDDVRAMRERMLGGGK